jgi:hypothetical protein
LHKSKRNSLKELERRFFKLLHIYSAPWRLEYIFRSVFGATSGFHSDVGWPLPPVEHPILFAREAAGCAARLARSQKPDAR